MANSSCPKCGNTTFEAKPAVIRNCPFAYHFIQCAACGAVVAVLPSSDTTSLLRQIASGLGVRLR